MNSTNRLLKDRDQDNFLAYWKEELEKLGALHILHWAVDSYYPRLALKTDFGPESCVILSLLSEIVPQITVLYEAKQCRSLNFQAGLLCFPRTSPLKIRPLCLPDPENRKGSCFDAVLSGERREKHPGIGVLGLEPFMDVPSIAPLARWTRDAVSRKLNEDVCVDSNCEITLNGRCELSRFS